MTPIEAEQQSETSFTLTRHGVTAQVEVVQLLERVEPHGDAATDVRIRDVQERDVRQRVGRLRIPRDGRS